jgi:hypothetical protein
MEQLMKRAHAVIQQLEAYGHYDMAEEFRQNLEATIAHGEDVVALVAA